MPLENRIGSSSCFYQKAVLDGSDQYQSLRQELKETFAAVKSCYGGQRLRTASRALRHRVSSMVVRRLAC